MDGRKTQVLPVVSYRKRFVATSEQIETIRRKYNLVNHKVLLTVGALEERKGIMFSLKLLYSEL